MRLIQPRLVLDDLPFLGCWPSNTANNQPVTPYDLSEWEPPDPLPNSAVKPLSADDSVGSPHVKVGHRQALILKTPQLLTGWGVFLCSF